MLGYPVARSEWVVSMFTAIHVGVRKRCLILKLKIYWQTELSRANATTGVSHRS